MKKMGFSLFISIIAALGGMLFGFHTSVIAGALLFIAKEFSLSATEQGFLVSILLAGALAGSFMGGFFADLWGRKKTLFFTTLLFFAGTFFEMIAHYPYQLLLGRMIAGLGVGIVSVVSPLYIAEVAETTYRGRLVAINQLATSLGILMGYLVNFFFAPQGNWRGMLGSGMFPDMLLFFGLFFIPETPSFLTMKGRDQAAKTVYQKIFGKDLLDAPKEQIGESKGWGEFVKQNRIYILFLGIMLSLFQQITGINVVIYYAPFIFKMAGFAHASLPLLGAIGIGVVGLTMSSVAFYFIDNLGRRFLLLLGVGGMAFSLLFVSLGLFFPKAFFPYLTFISLFTYVAFFSISLGPILAIVLSEIFPLAIRGKAMGIAMLFNWLANYFVSLSFLNLVEFLGKAETFLLYTLISFGAFWFIYQRLPETKAKSFAEIQKFLRKKTDH